MLLGARYTRGTTMASKLTRKPFALVLDFSALYGENHGAGRTLIETAVYIDCNVSTKTLEKLYHALVQPHFDYCSMVWGNCAEYLKGKLQKLQNRAARVITGDTYEIRSTDILNKLDWKTLSERRKEQQLKYLSKALTCQCPETITDMFKLSDSNMYELRSNKTKLMLSKPKSNSMKRTFSYAAAKVWNKEIDIKLLNQEQGVKIVT